MKTHTIATRLAPVTLLGAVVAGCFSVVAAHAGGSHVVRVIELPRVTVVARRVRVEARTADVGVAASKATPRVVELPRVSVVAKRTLPSATVVADRHPAGTAGV